MAEKNINETTTLVTTSIEKYSDIFRQGDLFYWKCEYEKAIEHFQKILSQKTISLFDSARCYNSIGAANTKLQKYDEAINNYNLQLDTLMKLGLPNKNEADIVKCYMSIGMVYWLKHDYIRAIDCHKQALSMFSTITATHDLISNVYKNLANLYTKTMEFEPAIMYFEKALEIDRHHLREDHLKFGQTYANIGAMYYSKEDYQQALKYFEQARKIWLKSLPSSQLYIESMEKTIRNVQSKLDLTNPMTTFNPRLSLRDIQDMPHRFSDVAREPCIMLAPINGFSRKPLVTLEEAVEPLNGIVHNIKKYVDIVKQRAAYSADDLSVDESASIALYTIEWEPYTESLYYILNSTLRTEARESLKPWFLYLKLIFTALSRLPSMSRTVYREVKLESEMDSVKYEGGNSVIWWGFSSCSTSPDIFKKEQFLAQVDEKILFVIDCITGKDISKHSYYKKENEVILLPATMFQVVEYEQQRRDLDVIYLREVEPLFLLLESVSTEEKTEALTKVPVSIRNVRATEKEVVVEPNQYFNYKLNKYIDQYKTNSAVYLVEKHLNEDDIKFIVQKLIIEKQCRTLYLKGNRITSQGANVIADALCYNNTLIELAICCNNVNDKGAKVLANALADNNNSKLKRLSLTSNNITDEGVEYLAAMLESNTTLTMLSLASNDMTIRGLRRLAEVLANNNRSLESLSLDWNKFKDDLTATILGDMLTKNQSLTSLSLRHCKLSRTAVRQLKNVAKTKKNFRLST